MTTFAQSETRMRRFLRDPDGLIWSSLDLQTYFNDAQVEMANKTGLIVRVENHYYPPQYDWSYTYDWERDYVGGTRYQMFMVNQASGDVITYPWEAAYYLSTQQTEDTDYRYMHPWEAHYVSSAETPAVPLHAKFDKMLFIAYDENRILPISKKELESADPFYKDRVGQVSHYWRPDDYSNIFYPYPTPSDITEQETGPGDVFVDTGGIITSDETMLDEGDIGVITDIIDLADAFLMIYQAQANEIDAPGDSSDYPDWWVKYIEYACLERAFGADTDGFIPTLRDYWKARKDLGIKALKRFQRMMLTDRDFVMGGQKRVTTSRRLRLPDHYPAS
jgi:hypothetical protein